MTDIPPECVFCQIVKGDAPAEIVGEDYHEMTGNLKALVIRPLNPVVDGHVLIIPREHVTDFVHSAPVTASLMFFASQWVMLRDEYAECNLITSRGEAATQSVFHLHLHVVPRVAGDGLELPWSSQQRRVAQRAAAEIGWQEAMS